MSSSHPHQQNRVSWNEATRIHNAHKKNQAEFLRTGGSTLFQEEVQLLSEFAENLKGMSVLHLQCNSGQDTLSLLQQFPEILHITGVDISDEAITFANKLSRDVGYSDKVTFVRSDLFDWFASEDEKYDVVFTSYGVLGWLSDLGIWAKGINKVLANDGVLCLVEFHPG